MLCPGTVHITVYCDSVAVDGPYSTALNTSDSTDVIEYTTSPLNIVQAPCQVVVNVSNGYISEAISKSFGKFLIITIKHLCTHNQV